MCSVSSTSQLPWLFLSHSTDRTPSGRLDGCNIVAVYEYRAGERRTTTASSAPNRRRRRRRRAAASRRTASLARVAETDSDSSESAGAPREEPSPACQLAAHLITTWIFVLGNEKTMRLQHSPK